MDYLLTEEQRELQKLTRDIARNTVAPKAEHYDRHDEFPWEMVEVFAQAGCEGGCVLGCDADGEATGLDVWVCL